MKAGYQLSNDEEEAKELAFQDIDAGKTYSSFNAVRDVSFAASRTQK